MTAPSGRVEKMHVSVYEVPTETPEADGTLQWDSTVAVIVQVQADGVSGLGWTYSTPAAATLISGKLADVIRGADAFDIAAAWSAMHRACRNYGTKGLVMQAISAVDVALWDLKARLLQRPVADLLGRCRDEVRIYGSGGFTDLDHEQLAQQVALWRDNGCRLMKIKIGESQGADPHRDLHRVEQLRELAGDDVELMVDANGGYTRGQACRVGSRLDELGVTWFEEPVTSDDVEGLRIVRDHLACDVTAGEYSSDAYDTERLCAAVDCVQLDATRCGGYTGFLRGAAVAHAHGLDVSAHCAPSLHVPVAAAIPNFRHLEWFIDHVRLEPLLLTGLPAIADGHLRADARDSGHGMQLRDDASRYLDRFRTPDA